MISVEQIAKRFATYNGMNLIDFGEIALPIYRVTASVLVHEAKSLATIEEFTLRSISLGFCRIHEIQGLLGLSERVVKGALTSLIRSELIVETGNGKLALTEHGSKESTLYSRSRPFEQQITFDYDGITRKVILGKNNSYLAPKEVKADGLVEIRPIPARRPNEDEIELGEVSEHLKQFTRISDSSIDLLRVRRITRGTRLFYMATMLIYKDSATNNYEAAFVIDGKISEAHGLAFLKSNGLEKLGILQAITGSDERNEVQHEYPDFTLEKIMPRQKPNKVQDSQSRSEALKGLKKQIAEKKQVSLDEKPKEEKSTGGFRPLPVHEHAEYLRDAVEKADKRLLIISPWITYAVVDHEFIRSVENRLKEGVEIYIGYGIGQEPNKDPRPIRQLEKLSDKYPNMTFTYLGDTHAKILIKDHDWYIITSFNWLSFKGDPNRTFREEWGTLVSDEQMVDVFFTKIKQRF